MHLVNVLNPNINTVKVLFLFKIRFTLSAKKVFRENKRSGLPHLNM